MLQNYHLLTWVQPNHNPATSNNWALKNRKKWSELMKIWHESEWWCNWMGWCYEDKKMKPLVKWNISKSWSSNKDNGRWYVIRKCNEIFSRVMSTLRMEVESMDCLQEFGQFKQLLNCNGLKENVFLKCPWFLLYGITDSYWFQNLSAIEQASPKSYNSGDTTSRNPI